MMLRVRGCTGTKHRGRKTCGAILGVWFGVTCVHAQIAVTMAQYDNARTNANFSETILDTLNVNQKTFGKLQHRPLDGYSYGPVHRPRHCARFRSGNLWPAARG